MKKNINVKKLLRYAEEPCRYYKEVEVHDLLMLHSDAFLNFICSFYEAYASGEVDIELPKKQVFYTPGFQGDYRVMPCSIRTFNEHGIYALKLIGTNEENVVVNDKICVGKSCLIHPQDHHVYAMFDVAALSSYRTAAISVLAYWLLQNNSAASIGIIGMGRIGFYTLFLLHKWVGIDKFYCHDSEENRENSFLELCNFYVPEAKVHVCKMDDVYTNSDAVFIATDSIHSVMDSKEGENISFVSSVGADASNLSELDADMLENRTLVTDSLQSTMLGDMKTWIRNGILDKKDIVTLSDKTLLQKTSDKRILFISTGVAIQDALVMQFIINNSY